MNETRPILGITMGDPAGVGPEIVLKALSDRRTFDVCRPVVVGCLPAIRRTAEALSPDTELRPVEHPGEAEFRPGVACVLDSPAAIAGELAFGEVSAVAGDLAFSAVRRAIELALDGTIRGVVTAPIHKESIQRAGHDFAGHTEILAHYTGSSDVAMLLAEGDIRTAHVSTHVSLRQACDLVRRDRVASVIRLLHRACLDLGIERPRIGVAGLNPHASDGGLFGHEEAEEIAPAIALCLADGLDIEGPLPADTMFAKAAGGYFDGCVAMYHDQGHIPFKVMGFSWDQAEQRWKDVCGVNITLGVPIVRTSVDHGTAFDIAGKGIASHTSLLNAIQYAARLATHQHAERVH